MKHWLNLGMPWVLVVVWGVLLQVTSLESVVEPFERGQAGKKAFSDTRTITTTTTTTITATSTMTMIVTTTISSNEVSGVLPPPDTLGDLDLLTEERLRERWNKFMLERTRPMEFNNSITSPQQIHTVRDKSLFLSCGFNRELTGRLRISFMRIQDLNLLAVSKKLHSLDPRIEIINSLESPQIWTLKLNRMRASDSGLYECQLNTQPKTLRRIFNVTVIEARIHIQPADNVTYLNVGSRLKLSCFVDSGPLKPQYMLWYRNDKIIQYSEDISARVLAQVGLNNRTHHRSDMIIDNVHESDSGEYRCSSDLTDQEARITVYVVREDSKSLHGGGNQKEPVGNYETRDSQMITSGGSQLARTPTWVLMVPSITLVWRIVPT
eukprot:TCALIF_03685-PA protein Name:"Similar to Dscaml1 Down syndrome cell adhesion molecule-like protein 1 homolog (Mus musculus)" AED:0.20 eAED:0.34 QI:0/-1/0/1/-1/1/1/0/379